jgi:hypothetical protein
MPHQNQTGEAESPDRGAGFLSQKAGERGSDNPSQIAPKILNAARRGGYLLGQTACVSNQAFGAAAPKPQTTPASSQAEVALLEPRRQEQSDRRGASRQ